MIDLAPSSPADEPTLQLSGEVRRLPARTFLRLLEAVTLILALRGLLALFLRYALHFRRHAELRAERGLLQLHVSTSVLGKTVARAEHVFVIQQLGELALEEHGEPPAFYAGLVALGLGTALGGWTLQLGLGVGAPSMLIAAALCLGLGVAADFLVGSGRRATAWSGSPQLLVRGQHAGFVLSQLSIEQARRFFDSVQAQLAHTSA